MTMQQNYQSTGGVYQNIGGYFNYLEKVWTDIQETRKVYRQLKGNDKKDISMALQTMGYSLLQLSKVMAPFMPFIAEQIWQRVTGFNFKSKDKLEMIKLPNDQVSLDGRRPRKP